MSRSQDKVGDCTQKVPKSTPVDTGCSTYYKSLSIAYCVINAESFDSVSIVSLPSL